jgi:RNA polymerase sigma-70 factor (ECF subfamily)
MTSLGPGVVNQVGVSADQDAWLARATLRAFYAQPLVERQVLILTSVEDMSYAEVAEVLGIPVSSVMSYLTLGRERLRQELEGQKTDSGAR